MFALQHIFLRLYASAHLMLMYGVSVSLLPAMGSPLRHRVSDGVLATLGLLKPSTTSSMLPVLSLLLLVYPWHTHLNVLPICSSWTVHGPCSTSSALQPGLY